MDERSKERRRRAKKLVDDMKNSHKYKEHPRTEKENLKPAYASHELDNDRDISKAKEEAKHYNRRIQSYKDLAPEEKDLPDDEVKSVKAENKRKIDKRIEKYLKRKK